jgi:hypothetical protein
VRDVVEAQALPRPVIIEGVTAVTGHLEVVDQDQRVSPVAGDDRELFGERQVHLPVSVEVEEDVAFRDRWVLSPALKGLP